jgi:hypothetical protein
LPEEPESIHKTFDEKVAILEKSKYTEIDHQTDGKEYFSLAVILGMAHLQANEVIYQGTDDDERQKTPIPKTVENVARKQQKYVADSKVPIEK